MTYQLWCKEADQTTPTGSAEGLDAARKEAARLATEHMSDCEIVDEGGNVVDEVLWEDAHWES